MKDLEQELIRNALPYWEVEATIVRRFFKSKPTREDHIFWLKAQLWKELHPVDGYFTGLFSPAYVRFAQERNRLTKSR